MFVELPNTVEGLVRLADMRDDYYVFDQARYTLTGERSGKSYGIGDEVRVRLVRASAEARQIDFVLLDGVESGRRKGRGGGISGVSGGGAGKSGGAGKGGNAGKGGGVKRKRKGR